MGFLSSLNISASALTAAQTRLDVISENLTNQNTTRTENGGPYRRKMVVYSEIPANQTFRSILDGEMTARMSKGGVQVSQILEDQTEFNPVYDPSNPDANEDGYVLMPNVDPAKETLDFMETTRFYESNLQAMNAMKYMISKSLELGR